jgi:hypothetical protein
VCTAFRILSQFGDGNAQQEKQMTDKKDMFPLIESGTAQSV